MPVSPQLQEPGLTERVVGDADPARARPQQVALAEQAGGMKSPRPQLHMLLAVGPLPQCRIVCSVIREQLQGARPGTHTPTLLEAQPRRVGAVGGAAGGMRPGRATSVPAGARYGAVRDGCWRTRMGGRAVGEDSGCCCMFRSGMPCRALPASAADQLRFSRLTVLIWSAFGKWFTRWPLNCDSQ